MFLKKLFSASINKILRIYITGDRALTLNVADPGLVPGIPKDPLSQLGVNHELRVNP